MSLLLFCVYALLYMYRTSDGMILVQGVLLSVYNLLTWLLSFDYDDNQCLEGSRTISRACLDSFYNLPISELIISEWGGGGARGIVLFV
jgi:hypothetical protein